MYLPLLEDGSLFLRVDCFEPNSWISRLHLNHAAVYIALATKGPHG